MFLSDTKDQHIRKAAISYTVISLLCILFALIYESFSHGVFSNYMIFMFTIPLLLGSVPFGILTIIGLGGKIYNRLSFNLYNSGVAFLTVGSCISGVLEIYGTTSRFTAFYWYVGAIFCIVGCILALIFAFNSKFE